MPNFDTLKPGKKKEFIPSNTKQKTSFETFLSDCSESISAMKQANHFLYRGIESDVPDIFIGKSRNKRKPLDTDPSISNSFDKILSASGFTSLRSNSIFCTGSYHQAGNYGDEFLIFPVNGFSYTWSPYVGDFTMDVSRTLPRLLKWKKTPKEIVNQYQYTNQNLSTALTSGNEITITGAYYAFYASKYEEYLYPIIIGK